MRAFKTMYLTEFKLTVRQLDVPIFGLLFPVLVSAVLGFVYASGGNEAMGKTFASACTIGICANGLMGLPLTLSQYRANKLLKQLKVTPIRSAQVLLVQFAVKATLSVLSSVLVWLTLVVLFDFQFIGNFTLFILGYILVVFAIFGIGMIIASVSANTNTTNLLCSIVYFPMLFLSGATLPLEILPNVLVNVLQFLPLTQGINLLETITLNQPVNSGVSAAIFLLVIGGLAIFIATKMFRWE
ncbi:ABC transporter permease [Enterococcus sp. LJL99]